MEARLIGLVEVLDHEAHGSRRAPNASIERSTDVEEPQPILLRGAARRRERQERIVLGGRTGRSPVVRPRVGERRVRHAGVLIETEADEHDRAGVARESRALARSSASCRARLRRARASTPRSPPTKRRTVASASARPWIGAALAAAEQRDVRDRRWRAGTSGLAPTDGRGPSSPRSIAALSSNVARDGGTSRRSPSAVVHSANCRSASLARPVSASTRMRS